MNTIAKLAEHTRRQLWARYLSAGQTEKLARIQTLPLFEVAMYGKAAVHGKRKVVSNLPSLRKAA